MQETQFQTLKDYINKAYEADLNDVQITEKLVAAGWAEQDVITVIRTIKTSQVYAQPTNINSVPFEQSAQNTNFKDTNKPFNPPKYNVTEAFKDGFNAISSNIAKVLLAGLILLVTYAVFAAAIIFVIFAGILSGGLYQEMGSWIPILIYFIVLIIAGAWFNAVFITGMSVPVKDAMDGRNTTLKELISLMYLKSWRVALAQLGLYLVMLGPIFIGSILSAFLRFGGGGSALITIIALLASIVWVVMVVLRFVLAPYIALFDPSVPLTKIYSKSYSLLKGGGQWFLFKFYLLIFVGYIIFVITSSTLSSQSSSATTLGGTVAYGIGVNIVGFLLGVLVNSVFIALYVNRTDYLDPSAKIDNMSGLNQGANLRKEASSSPLAGPTNLP